MKKLFCLGLILITLLSCLTACNFSKYLTNAFEESEPSVKVEEMIAALSENRISDAKALMHPQAKFENLDAAIEQMAAYLTGRNAVSIELSGISRNYSTGTSGNDRQDDVLYKVTLNDSDTIYINASYLSDHDGKGFTAFQLVLGIM